MRRAFGHVLDFLWKLFILGFTATETVLLFQDIAPKNAPWLPYFALAACEYGVLKWPHWLRYNAEGVYQHTLAFCMTVLSALAVGSTTFIELTRQFSNAGLLNETPWLATVIIFFLIAVFVINVFAVFIKQFTHPEMIARMAQFENNGKLISRSISQDGNLISRSISQFPAQFPIVTVKELERQQQYITGQLAAMRGGDADPLAGRRLPRPSTREVALANVQTLDVPVGKGIKEGLSTLLTNASKRIKRGRPGGRVPGDLNGTTGESMPTSESDSDEERTDLDVWSEAYARSGAQMRGVTFPDFVRQMKGLDEEEAVQPAGDEDMGDTE